MTMLTGYNTDFKFQGKIYHVQTEDGGLNSPFITSLLYSKGEILCSRKTSYEDIVKADCLEDVVRELMMEQHKQMIRDLMQGRIETDPAARKAAAAAPAPKPEPAPEPVKEIKEAPQPVVAAPAPPPPPPPAEELKEKSLDDIILDFLAQEQKERTGK